MMRALRERGGEKGGRGEEGEREGGRGWGEHGGGRGKEGERGGGGGGGMEGDEGHTEQATGQPHPLVSLCCQLVCWSVKWENDCLY